MPATQIAAVPGRVMRATRANPGAGPAPVSLPEAFGGNRNLFKRLRATAGQGPNYVGPSCGYMLAYVGVCWPILRATWAHLVAMLAYVCLMLAHVEPKDPKNGSSKKML